MCGRFHIGERMISGLGSAMAPNKMSCCESVSVFHIFINGNNDSFLLKKLLEVHNLLKCHVFFSVSHLTDKAIFCSTVCRLEQQTKGIDRLQSQLSKLFNCP